MASSTIQMLRSKLPFASLTKPPTTNAFGNTSTKSVPKSTTKRLGMPSQISMQPSFAMPNTPKIGAMKSSSNAHSSSKKSSSTTKTALRFGKHIVQRTSTMRRRLHTSKGSIATMPNSKNSSNSSNSKLHSIPTTTKNASRSNSKLPKSTKTFSAVPPRLSVSIVQFWKSIRAVKKPSMPSNDSIRRRRNGAIWQNSTTMNCRSIRKRASSTKFAASSQLFAKTKLPITNALSNVIEVYSIPISPKVYSKPQAACSITSSASRATMSSNTDRLCANYSNRSSSITAINRSSSTFCASNSPMSKMPTKKSNSIAA